MAGLTIAVGSNRPVEAREVELIAEECGHIKRLLTEEVLTVKKDNLIHRCFSFHQKCLIRLIDECTAAGGSPSSSQYVGESENVLMDLLGYLERQFSEYFDHDVRPPESLRDSIRNEINHASQSIADKYRGTSLDENILQIVLTDLSDLMNVWPEFSYRKLYLVRILESRLLAIDSTIDNGDLLRQDFCRELIRINFNTERFFDYYTRHITATLSVCETLADRIEQISYFYKICSQEHRLQNAALVAGPPTIRDQLLGWISQEMEHLNTKRQLRLTDSVKDDGLLSDFKLSFDLSVSQLAYLFRAFIETGVIQNKNTSELARFLSKFVKTKKSEAISNDSFRIKFYNVESGTKDAVKKMLQSMIQYMNRN